MYQAQKPLSENIRLHIFMAFASIYLVFFVLERVLTCILLRESHHPISRLLNGRTLFLYRWSWLPLRSFFGVYSSSVASAYWRNCSEGYLHLSSA